MKKCSSAPLSTLFDDPFLKPFLGAVRRRNERTLETEHRLTGGKMSLADFASGHEYFGLHRRDGSWVFREWAPNATGICLIGSFSDWNPRPEHELSSVGANGVWEITLPLDRLKHLDLYRLLVRWPGGEGSRIPAYARRVVQDENTKIFNAQVWCPDKPYSWRHSRGDARYNEFPLVYEAHVGMALERPGIGTWNEFAEHIIPRIVEAGYDTIELMAVMEHAYYGSFGYHVSSFFAASSRFGTPDELKALVDAAHEAGLSVIMDLVHSHAAINEVEGISRFDGTSYQYFHKDKRGFHDAWGSRCFDYGKPEVLHFLLSNCRFWLDEYHMDGFRFDGVTSMLYLDHGMGSAFDSYDRYFDSSVDEDAYVYLSLANKLIHHVNPTAITIAEDVSGMPGLAAPAEAGGCGFDYRLAMGVPDCWFKLVKEVSDENWNIGWLWRELTNRRADEKTISYAECHDQALVGGKTLMFEMAGAAMYHAMRIEDDNILVARAMALHKMIRLATIGTAGHGYLNFMGNEFGHPEWIDFPREGNNWSCYYARRQWSLRDDKSLKYKFLAEFDKAMTALARSAAFSGARPPTLLFMSEEDKIFAFSRGLVSFIFNFHPRRSVSDYSIEMLPGEYALIMNSDEERFGGQGRIESGQRYFTHPLVRNRELRHFIKIYLPCRTAIVLRRSDESSENRRAM